jgi:hypothetical protein
MVKKGLKIVRASWCEIRFDTLPAIILDCRKVETDAAIYAHHKKSRGTIHLSPKVSFQQRKYFLKYGLADYRKKSIFSLAFPALESLTYDAETNRTT